MSDDFSSVDSTGSDFSAGGSSGSDTYTEVSSQSWFSRIGQALFGLIIGPILVLVGIGLLVWNEDRAVTTARSLAEGLGAVISIDADAPLLQNDGHLVHVAGQATATAKLSDPDFQISVSALTLHRQVQMLQWHEREQSHTDKNFGGSTTTVKTYTYTRDWSSARIDSSRFRQPVGHLNPAFPLFSKVYAAKDASLGGFHVGETMLTKLAANAPVDINVAAIEPVKARLGRPVSEFDGGLFVGHDAAEPQIGDLKITFAKTPKGDITIVAEQQGNQFTGYQTRAGDILQEIRLGILTPKQVFADLETQNTIITWVLRAAGAMLVMLGFMFFFGFIPVLADFIPFLGSIVGAGTFFLSFSFTFIVVPLTIAVAWLAFRPLVSLVVIAVGIAGFLLVSFLRPKKPRLVPSRGAVRSAPPPVASEAPPPLFQSWPPPPPPPPSPGSAPLFGPRQE